LESGDENEKTSGKFEMNLSDINNVGQKICIYLVTFKIFRNISAVLKLG